MSIFAKLSEETVVIFVIAHNCDAKLQNNGGTRV